MIQEPPTIPPTHGLPPEVQNYFRKLDSWMRTVYQTLSQIDIGQVKISSGADVPTGGDDGDLYIRVAGASTKLYLNINGTFSGFNNP